MDWIGFALLQFLTAPSVAGAGPERKHNLTGDVLMVSPPIPTSNIANTVRVVQYW